MTGSEGLAKFVDNAQGLITIVLIAIGALLTVWIGRKIIRRTVRKLVETDTGEPTQRRAQRARTIGSVMRSILSILVWTLAVFWILSVLNVNLAPLIAGAGLVGIALGFGAQSLVKDFLSGIFMLMEDQFGVGDVIDVGEASGVVESISLRVTDIRDNDGVLWHVPNGFIERVGNKTQQWARAVIDIGISYDADVDQANQAIADAAQSLWDDPAWRPLMLDEPEVLGVETLGLDRVTLRATVRTLPLERWKVAREFRARVKAGFDQAGIELPAPRPYPVPTDPGAGTGPR